ncbi:fungal-specific transcription factor domain-containing protein [Trichoderma afarasin]
MAPGALTVDDTPMDVASDHEGGEEPISKLSCEMCRRRKVKCDRMRPACGWCTRNSRGCVYKEKRKYAEESERNDQLEVRLGHLDALVQGLRQRVDNHISHHDAHHEISHSPKSKSPSTHHDRHHSWHATASPESTRSDMLSEGARPPTVILDRPFNITSGVKLPRSFSTSMKTVYEQQVILSTDPDLPPNDLLYILVDLFFKHINTWFPLLDRKATFGTYFGSTSVSRGDRVVLFAIIATTLRFATDARLTPSAKQKLHDDCKQKVELYALENVNLFSLKALTLLSLDVLGTSNELQGQSLLSLLVHNITHLGLCIEKGVYFAPPMSPKEALAGRVALPEPDSWIEDEGRRRLSWMVYVLDRYATLATPYKFILAEEDMKRFLPCRYDLWSSDVPVETRWPNGLDNTKLRLTVNAPENLGSFSYHCEVLCILSRVHNFLAKPLDIYSIQDVRSWQSTFVALQGELSAWLRDLPAEYGQISVLCHSDPGARIINWIMLHAAFVVSTIRLNSAAAYPVVQNDVFVPSYTAIQTCLSAVESLRSIVQDVIETSGLSLLGPHFAFSLWTSARLLLVHAATMGCEIDSNVDFFVGTLAEMGRYWEIAANYSAILGRVTEEGRQGDKTLTEMRQHAHELSMLSSSTRLSALEPTSTRISSANELDYLEIFDFFNYPRSADHGSTAPYEIEQHLLDYESGSASLGIGVEMPSVESDWLQYETH